MARTRALSPDRIACWDLPAEPAVRRADRYGEDGRGLMLVAQLAERWGTRYTRNGKMICAQQRAKCADG